VTKFLENPIAASSKQQAAAAAAAAAATTIQLNFILILVYLRGDSTVIWPI